MRKGWGAILVAAALLTAGSRSLLALEPPSPGEIQRYMLDGSFAARLRNAQAFGNHLVAPDLLSDLALRMGWVRRAELRTATADPGPGSRALPSGTRNVMPGKGTDRIFALLIQFPDYPAVNSKETIAAKIFGDGDGTGYPYESVRNYYRRSSYGMLEIAGNVLGWYTPSYTRASMAQTSTAREALIKEALAYFDAQGHNFAAYDNDNNGSIDYFVVIWTGPNNGWANFWWGYQTSFSGAFALDGKSFQGTRYSWQWESRNWPGAYDQIVVMHETGHALGLPDYYDYDATVGPKGGVGGLDMMDANRGDHNAFSKMLLDWNAPQAMAVGTRNFTLGASGNTRDALVLMPEFTAAQPFTEFFIVQNRLRVENDTGLPGDGLLVWHVDARLTTSGAFVYDNSYTAHKLLRLMEADGLEQIELGYSATAADYYTAGRTFLPYGRPASQRYDLTDSGVSIYGLGASQQTMAFTADIHYSLAPPKAPALERRTDDYVFFYEYVNKLTWSADPQNRVPIVKYTISVKERGAPDGAYVLLAEVAGGAESYEHRGLRASGLYSYRIVAIDQNGVSSAPAEVANP